MPKLSRRDALSLLATPAIAAPQTTGPTPTGSPVELHSLNGRPSEPFGTSWGLPFAKGTTKTTDRFTLGALPLSQWPLAYWPDGSVKWMGFATVIAPDTPASALRLSKTSTGASAAMVVRQTVGQIEVQAGKVTARLNTRGAHLIESMTLNGREIARAGRLVCSLEDRSRLAAEGILRFEEFVSEIRSARVESCDAVRTVVKFEGVHKSRTREWLPFVVRLYFYKDSAPVRVLHTVIFDGDDQKDFIRSLGLAFEVPLREQVHNRHVRFSGELPGLWAEPVQPLTGRRTLNYQGRDVYPDQLQGKAVPNQEAFDARSQALLRDWAVWDSFKLVQSNPHGFTVHKRAAAEACWLEAGAGTRSSGYAFIGDTSGGLGVSIRNFWQSYPAALEIQGASTPVATLHAWLWSPDAPAMDLRHYDTKAHGLEASYEDVQPGFSTPHGVARTSELMLFPTLEIPAKTQAVLQAGMGQNPPRLVGSPEYLHTAQVFGAWSLPDRSTSAKAQLEERLEKAFVFYQKEVEQRSWYGFWNYGDIMHQYDTDRHVWRYDVGGFAWDNSELVPDMWLWYTYLRTGRSDVFQMAEAMTRHTGEVDTYHIGKFAHLGSRHNVRHWGCGAKEVRISQASLRRFYYYLTADERTGDIMREMVDADLKLTEIDPMRLARPTSQRPSSYPARVRGGPDWVAFVGNWMTEWERTGNTKYRDKILAGVESLAAMPYGMLSGPEALFGYDPATGKLYPLADDPFGSYNLAMIMGGAEVLFELEPLLNDATFNKIWLQYCRLLGAPKDVVKRDMASHAEVWFPGPGRGGNAGGAGGRLWAYCYAKTKDARYAELAKQTLLGGPNRAPAEPRKVTAPQVLHEIEEIPGLSTNSTSQWCLNAMEILALCGDQI